MNQLSYTIGRVFGISVALTIKYWWISLIVVIAIILGIFRPYNSNDGTNQTPLASTETINMTQVPLEAVPQKPYIDEWGKCGEATVVSLGGKRLRIRERPGLEYGIIGYLHEGETIEILCYEEERNNMIWQMINYQGLRGWVSNSYLLIYSEVYDDNLPCSYISRRGNCN